MSLVVREKDMIGRTCLVIVLSAPCFGPCLECLAVGEHMDGDGACHCMGCLHCVAGRMNCADLAVPAALPTPQEMIVFLPPGPEQAAPFDLAREPPYRPPS